MEKLNAGLYLHVPFCLRKCPYCDFYSIPVKVTKSLEKNYLNALKIELTLLKSFLEENFGIKRISFITFYAGGGTPSLLSPHFYENLFDFLAKFFKFSPEELTLEANPETLTLEKTKAFYKTGFNRISLGVQSFSQRGLKFLGRLHSVKDNLKALDYILKAGFKNFSLDFIFGWKGQGEKTLEKEILKASEFKSPHFSFYELTLEKGTPFYQTFKEKKHWIGDKKLIKFYYLIEKTLEAHGYKRYEISNYALPKFKCRHNLIYWKIKPYLGLGPSAVSRVENLRWENPKNLNHYLNALLKENRLPLKIVESLDNYELAKEYIFMGLRLKEGISLNLLKEKFNYTIPEVKADILIKKNLIEKRKGRIRLTFEGKLLHNQIVSFLWKSLCN
ncbi:MAG: radical SAM family heme chaperone HemW [Thermodesulfobacterium sp.]|nr:radical SAM family heme chaperone HemW [Thermodesulfobacterium sp.]